MMATRNIYLITTKIANRGEAITDMVALIDRKLYDISFEKVMDPPFKKWYLKTYEPCCEIIDPNNIKDEMFDKYGPYSGNKHLSHLYNIYPLNLQPGEYFPRVFRPQIINQFASVSRYHREMATPTEKADIDYIPFEHETLVSGVTQLSLLTEELKVICRTVAPSHKNFKVFGHEIRNLLTLVCTEVEAQLSGIYRANREKKQLNMKDYFELNEYLKLDQYSVRFSLYPWLDHFTPFKTWATPLFTALPWYTAYNKVKHDREGEFEKASLENLLDAMAALAALLIAQYGEGVLFWKDLIGNFFSFDNKPNWPVEECYLPPISKEDWRQKQLKM